MFTVTVEQMTAFGKGQQSLVDAINETAQRFSINITPRRMRYFLAQGYSETGGFNSWIESLYYSTPDRIASVWPTRFHSGAIGKGPLNAADYIKNPEKLANEVYANRMGNGSPESGDGFKYIGRGMGHITGKDAYRRYSQKLFNDDRLVVDPSPVAEYRLGCLTFGLFWDENGFNELADKDQFTEMTRRLNGASGDRLKAVVNERLPNLNKANRIFVWNA